ncbi:hypothetical protein GCM10009836_28560 [Pseudonocardia ailaonensis]|uniref:DUF4439 domain-containing protein n=1 Tax=Pseudonocardia ailaonensis TaxID=367279 RepID=A0ABN2N1X6_9PSEU
MTAQPLDPESARVVLGALHAEVGAAGLAAAAALPGLGAMIDQHAASLREHLTAGTDPDTGLVLLATYARDARAHVEEHGWQPPTPGAWSHADRNSLRLTAICALTERLHASPDVLPPLDLTA